jgi:hypothetical protein
MEEDLRLSLCDKIAKIELSRTISLKEPLAPLHQTDGIMKNGRAVPFFVNAQSTESTRVSGQSQAHTKQNRKYIPVDGYISYVVIEAPLPCLCVGFTRLPCWTDPRICLRVLAQLSLSLSPHARGQPVLLKDCR